MNGKTNGGNIISQNFVTATSLANLPSIAAEDTFGLITTVAVNGFYFNNERPAGRPTGEVRVKLGKTANNAVSKLAKNNTASAFPISVYQFDGSNWGAIEAYLRVNGAWSRIRCDFYTAGSTNLIGTMTGYRSSTSAIYYTIGTSDFLISTIATSPYSCFSCVYGGTAVDLTNIDVLKISYARIWVDQTGVHKVRIYVNSSVLASGTNASFSEGEASADLPVSAGGTVSLNTSSLTGTKYIHVAVGRSTYSTVDSVYVNLIYGE